jgi:hypothetical protein
MRRAMKRGQRNHRSAEPSIFSDKTPLRFRRQPMIVEMATERFESQFGIEMVD